MGQAIEASKFNFPPPAKIPNTDVELPNFLIGDEAFALSASMIALSASMMKPYSQPQSVHDSSEAIHNYRHSWARRTTENAFGIMASYFRIFHTEFNHF